MKEIEVLVLLAVQNLPSGDSMRGDERDCTSRMSVALAVAGLANPKDIRGNEWVHGEGLLYCATFK